mgnify:CR=1 FL=1
MMSRKRLLETMNLTQEAMNAAQSALKEAQETLKMARVVVQELRMERDAVRRAVQTEKQETEQELEERLECLRALQREMRNVQLYSTITPCSIGDKGCCMDKLAVSKVPADMLAERSCEHDTIL